MRRFALLCGAVPFVLLRALDANANIHGGINGQQGGGGGGSYPWCTFQGTAVADGCAAANPNALVKNPSFFSNSTTNGIADLGVVTAGSGYTGTGTYTNVPLTGGTGSGATATVVVAGGAVTQATMKSPGSGYTLSDSLSASNTNLGGAGSGFAVTVALLDAGMMQSGQTYGNRTFTQTTNGSTGGWSGGGTTINMTASPPFNIGAGMTVFDVTTSQTIGTVFTWLSSTNVLQLTSGALASGSAGDTLRFTGTACLSASVCRPQWNVAGVDYPAGADATATKDPFVDTLPTGCTPVASGTGGVPQVQCASSSATNYDFENFNFTDASHGCVQIYVTNSGVNGALIVNNSRFVVGPVGSSHCTISLSNSFIIIGSSATTSLKTVTVTNSTLDGSWSAANASTMQYGAYLAVHGTNMTTGKLTMNIKNNALLNMPTYAVSANGGYADVTYGQNYVNGFSLVVSGLHGVWSTMLPTGNGSWSGSQTTPTSGTLAKNFNTVTEPNNVAQGLTAYDALDGNYTNFDIINVVQWDHNSYISNGKAGGGKGTDMVVFFRHEAVLSLIATNNWFDTTGVQTCLHNGGNGAGGTASTYSAGVMTVSNYNGVALYPNSYIGINSASAATTWGIVQPYGTSGTTGLGYTAGSGLSDTYAITGGTLTGMTGFQSFTTYTPSTTIGGNIDALDGSNWNIGDITQSQWYTFAGPTSGNSACTNQ